MAHSNSSMKNVEVLRIAPETGPHDHHRSLPLTFFDLLWIRFAPVERLYFYEASSSGALLPKLKSSLFLTLQHFLPLAGNITWPKESCKPVLGYVQGDTVSLTVAESDYDFDRLSSGDDFVESQAYSPLVPRLEIFEDRAATMALQITVFPNRGFSIGIVMHHAVADGKTLTSFVKAWAQICKHELGQPLSSSLLPFFDRSVVKDPNGLAELYSVQHQNMNGQTDNRSLLTLSFHLKPQELIRGTFQFTKPLIQTLRSYVTTKTGSDSSLHLSTFSLVCAYTWVCLVKAEEIKGERTVLIISIDTRARMDPPVPETYFGNCVVGRLAVAETKALLGEDGLVVAVSAITEAIKSLEIGVLNGAEKWVTNFFDFSLYSRIYSIAGSHRFGVYDTDFGWGRPKKVEVVSIEKTGAISLSESKNGGGGVEVGLVLKNQYMKAFASLFSKHAICA